MYSHVSMRDVSKSCDKGFHCTTALRVFLIETLGAFFYLGIFFSLKPQNPFGVLAVYAPKTAPPMAPYTVLQGLSETL